MVGGDWMPAATRPVSFVFSWIFACAIFVCGLVVRSDVGSPAFLIRCADMLLDYCARLIDAL